MSNINDLMENARLKGRVISLEAQLESERAEVERLNTGIQPEGNNDAVGRAVNLLLEREKEIARLISEVERLRKAGDDMAFHYQELVRIEWGQMTTHIPPSVIRWNAAKEGKPSV